MEDQTLQPAEQSAEPVETGAESAPDSDGQHEEKATFSEEQQAKVNEIIGEKTFKARQRERELQADLEAERAARQQLEAQIPTKQRPDIPVAPDPYDDNYEGRMQQRDQAIQEAAEFDAREQVLHEARQAELQRQNIEASRQLEETVKSYSKRAVQLGITEQELQQIGTQINQFGIHENIAEYMLKDPQGPLMAKYLVQNPSELDEISRSDPNTALVHVATQIKEKASGLIVKTSVAPDPPELLKGSGMPRSRRGPNGTTFE